MLKQLDTENLTELIVSGNQQAEEELVRRYRQGLSAIIYQIVKNRSATEDLSQEAFTIALEKIRRGDVRDPERLSGFICGVARNLAINFVRKSRQSAIQEDIGEAEDIPDTAPGPLEKLLEKEKGEIARQVINELKSKRDREVLIRYYITEEDKDEICDDLGLTRTQFNHIIFRAVQRYRELYEKKLKYPFRTLHR